MVDTVASDAPTQDELDSLVARFQQEKAAIANQHKEIAMLIKQAVVEVDRLSQRSREISGQMRQLQSNIEAFSRAEIQQRYAAYQEAQMRLFMMQSQLEQLRSRQSSLEKSEEMLGGFLEAVAHWGSAGRGADGSDTSSGPKGSPSLLDEANGEKTIPSIELVYHRVSKELQDGTAQSLSDLILRAEVCERLVRVDALKAREELTGLKQAAAGALRSTRLLIQELQPPALEELGLTAALRRYVSESRPGGRMQIEMQISGQERRLPSSVELAMFRIVQEALLNASEHSNADRAEVKLRFEPGEVVVTVADEGQGFDVTQTLEASARRDHSGLTSMQLRAQLIGATLEISSKPGSGCMISLAIPS